MYGDLKNDSTPPWVCYVWAENNAAQEVAAMLPLLRIPVWTGCFMTRSVKGVIPA